MSDKPTPPRNVISGLTPDDYSRMIEIGREVASYQTSTNVRISQGLVRAVVSQLDKVVGRENRNAFLSMVFHRGIQSSKDLTMGEGFGLVLWSGFTKEAQSQADNPKWHPSARFETDVNIIRQWYGQTTFFQENSDEHE